MQIKVCGLNNEKNILSITELPVDYIGFIFYKKSPRYIEKGNPDLKRLREIPGNIKKTGVFVNESLQFVFSSVEKYNLEAVQLHGEEPPAYCKELMSRKIKVIKSLSISNSKDFLLTNSYLNSCNFFLFDTKTDLKGGSGIQFNWQLLEHYKGSLPFFLSGGISNQDTHSINQLSHPLLYGVDINSKFENSPGLKDVNQIKNFIEKIRQK